MKDISLLEKILGKFLSHEQIAALTEEISKGVSLVNSIMDKNEKVKATKELVVETFKSVDRMIAQSNKIPAAFKLFYDTAKIKIHDLLEPIITGMVMENDFSDLDDIPDVNKNDHSGRPENNERHQENQNNNQQQNGAEQGGRRRRRRHGRNRNNNHNVETFPETSQAKPEPKPVQTSPETSHKPEPKPVQTSHETSPLKPVSKPEPKQASKPAPKPEPKPESVQTSPETSQKPETEPKPKPARRGRTPKKNVETPESKSVETSPETSPAKPARKGRTPRKPKETNE